jgi:hypothetical protein
MADRLEDRCAGGPALLGDALVAARKEPLVALATFQAEVKGETVLVHAGDVYPTSSPVVKGREEAFVAQSKYVQTGGTPPAE